MPDVTVVSLTLLNEDPVRCEWELSELREELLTLDVDSAEFAPSDESSPEGAKGPDPDSVTTLVISLTGSPVLVRLGRVI